MGKFKYPNSKFRFFIISIIFFVIWNFCYGSVLCNAAEDLYESRLDKGLFNTEPYSYLFIKMAHEDRGRAMEFLNMAKRYSPDLPVVYFELAREGLSPSARGIFQGLDYFRQGIKAYERNFWWEFTIAELFYAGLLISFVLSMLFILVLRLLLEAGLILHDCTEDRMKLLLLIVPIFLSLFGPVALIAGAFFLLGLYFKSENKAVVYASLLFFLLSPILLSVGERFLSAPSSGLRAIVAVNEGKDNRYALWSLKGRNDFASRFSYALALKREGYYDEAIDVYRSLTGNNYKPDPRVYVNLGNSYYAIKDIEAAKDSYQRSIGITPLPSAFYDLSEIHRETLNFAKGNEYFIEAAKLNPEAVSKFISVTGSNPNRFVVDETLPISAIWGHAMRAMNGPPYDFPLLATVLAVIMVPGFYLTDKKIKYRAHRCKRCGEVFCRRCSRVITWGEMCPRCYSSLIKIDEADLKERVTRLLAIYHNQAKRRRTVNMFSYMIPGAGQIYSGKILSGLLFLWTFLFSLTLLVMNHFPLTGLFPFTHEWTTPLAVLLMGGTYAVSLFHMRRRIHRGWL